jgi:glutathione S-transferase
LFPEAIARASLISEPSAFPSLQVSQIAEAMNGQSVRVPHALVRKPLDMSREPTPRLQVQVMPGHAAVNLDRTSDRLGNGLYRRHGGQRAGAARVPHRAGRQRNNAQHSTGRGEIFMKLLWSSRSPFVRKVVVVAHELGIADRIELQRVNVTASATNAEVTRFNPLNKIPTLLLDDGSVMIDSPVIAEYLDETYGKGELFCREAVRHWQVRRLHALGDGIMNFNIARLGEKARGEKASEIFTAAFLAKTKATLDVLEQETEQLEPLSIGSIAVGVALAHLDFRFAKDAWRDRRPRLAAWHARFAERASIRATTPEDVY